MLRHSFLLILLSLTVSIVTVPNLTAAADVTLREGTPEEVGISPHVLAACDKTVARGQAIHRPRLREMGISIGILSTGPTNSLTDVEGVQVGHHTIVEGDSIRTGVTAVKPHAGNVFLRKVPALSDVTVEWAGAAGSFQPLADGGVYFASDDKAV